MPILRTNLIYPLILTLSQMACSEHGLNATDKNVNNDDTDSQIESDVDLPTDHGACSIDTLPPEELPEGDACPPPPIGGFTPIVEWDIGQGNGCLSLPTVGDINLDGMPDVVINLTSLFNGPGSIVVASGDGSGEHFRVNNAGLAYGSPITIGDINNDGKPELVGIKEYAQQMFSPGDYGVAAWDNQGNLLWESDHFTNRSINWATAPILVDMNSDGAVEIVAGRVILNADGSVRGVGEYGQGSYGYELFMGDLMMVEGGVPAVTDLDLDGEMEIIVGNAWYDIDGNTKFHDPNVNDAMISVADLDDDPEGEYIAVTYNTIRAVDTDGSTIWGPIEFPEPANILSSPAIGDIDNDGYPEIITAGGNVLQALNHDGSLLWSANIVDESGATGASIFDFEGDGVPEVVYIDEIKMYAFDGPTGGIKFSSSEHGSNTMMDYPVIADVDNDNQAEILVCHNGYSSAMSVYGDQDESWVSSRSVWNQHAYHINNINDDLSIPIDPEPSFVHSNTYHSGVLITAGEIELQNIEAEILDVCKEECENGTLWMTVRLNNRGETVIQDGISMSLFGIGLGVETYLATITLAEPVQPGWTSESYTIGFFTADIESYSAISLKVDSDETGRGFLQECSESDNVVQSDEANCN